MQRCKSCLYKSDVTDGICPVCGIEQDKPKRDLTPEEKRVRYAARGVRAAALINTLGGAFALIAAIPFITLVNHGGKAAALSPVHGLVLAGVGVALLILASGLRRFAKWACYATLALYACLLVCEFFAPSARALFIVLCTSYLIYGLAHGLFNRTDKKTTPPPLPH